MLLADINLERVLSLRSADENQEGMFNLSSATPCAPDHPLHPIKKVVCFKLLGAVA